MEATSPETLISDDAPINELIDWTQDPEIEFTPKKKITNPDGTFTYVPDGPPARAKITRPTPSVLFTEDGVGNLTPGDEFIINNKKITIPAVPGAVLNEIECNGGFGYTASGTSSKGQKAVKVSSCSAAAITVRDGCRGGAYKEVLDFHIVRTFQQLSTLTGAMNSETDMSGLTSSTSGTHVAGLTSATVSTTTTNSGNTITQTPTMTTNTEFTGGSGYVVGDRLRVVGGTPVPSPFGKLHELCVELPGAFYSSEANVKVFVGEILWIGPATGVTL